MKKILLLAIAFLLLLPSLVLAACETCTLTYGTTGTCDLNLWLPDGSAHYTSTAPVAGDIKISQNDGAETDCVTASGACMTDEGSFYSIILDSTETDNARIYVSIRDVSGAAWLDKCLIVRTVGNASATFPIPDVNAIQISGDSTAADNAEAFFDGTGYVGGTAKLTVDVAKWNGTTVATPATAGYPAVTIKDGTGTGEIDTSSGAVASVTTAGTCSALGATAKTDVNTEMLDVLTVDTVAELSACPAATATLRDKITFLFEYFRHKVTASTTATTMYKDDGSTPLCTNAISDSGSLFTRGELN